MAAYSGRRAVFAAYPAVEDGLEVKSEGPAPIHFEYKMKGDLLLVSYIAPRPGRYWLRVSRFGQPALGSPFVLTIEDAPPGYNGYFGAGLWYQVPVRAPILSGIVDFVTEKMYMDENGQLFKLNKDGSVSNERYLIKRRKKSSVQEMCKTVLPTKLDKTSNTTNRKIDKRDKSTSSKLKKPLITDDIIEIRNKENLQNVRKDKSNKFSTTIIKGLNENLKLLNTLSTDCNLSNENIVKSKRHINVPEIKITHHATEDEPQTKCNQSREDQFLSRTEYRYIARRTAKLVAGDDAVISEPCDGRGQIGAQPQGQNRTGISATNDCINFVSQSGRKPKSRKKYHPSNLFATLGLSKSNNNLSGIKLLHQIYRIEENPQKKEDRPNIYCSRVLNNEKMEKKDYSNICKLTTDHDLEINNLETNNIYPKVYNSKQISTALSDSHVNIKRCGNKLDGKLARKNHKESNKISESFRTLSLPDFSGIFSLSVQGLRKAKSCGDRSFRVISSSSFSIKHLFEKDRVYHFNKKYHHDKTKSKGAATLVRIAHYGSEKETKGIETGYKSVDEWKKYWEAASHKKEKEVVRGCSLEIKGIVTKGKELFEKSTEEPSFGTNLCRQIPKENSQKNFDNPNSEKNEDNKSAFQKAKQIFEGNYTSLKDLDDPQCKRKRSISERFHIFSLSKDIYSGVTPEHLGIPNRLPVVASLGSIYNPVYPHLTLTLPQEYGYSLSWNDLLFSDPSYV